MLQAITLLVGLSLDSALRVHVSLDKSDGPSNTLLDPSTSSSELLTMGSMLDSSSHTFEDVSVVQGSLPILEFRSGSGVMSVQNMLFPDSSIAKMHLASTQLKFRTGNLEAALKKYKLDEGLAKKRGVCKQSDAQWQKACKYGEELKAPEACTDLAVELKKLQDDAPPGSKFLICSVLGTSAKESELERQGRPQFDENRALNMKKHLQAAMVSVGASAIISDPIVKYRKKRVALVLMKTYTGTEPRCDEDEINIPDIEVKRNKRSSKSEPEALKKLAIEEGGNSESDTDVDQDLADAIEQEDLEKIPVVGDVVDEVVEDSSVVRDPKETIAGLRTELEGLDKKARRKKLRALMIEFAPDKHHGSSDAAYFHQVFQFIVKEWQKS